MRCRCLSAAGRPSARGMFCGRGYMNMTAFDQGGARVVCECPGKACICTVRVSSGNWSSKKSVSSEGLVARESGGGDECRPRCVRIRMMTAGSVRNASTTMIVEHRGQESASMSRPRRRSCAHASWRGRGMHGGMSGWRACAMESVSGAVSMLRGCSL